MHTNNGIKHFTNRFESVGAVSNSLFLQKIKAIFSSRLEPESNIVRIFYKCFTKNFIFFVETFV